MGVKRRQGRVGWGKGGGWVVGKKKKKGEVGDDEVGRMEGGRRKGR